MWKRPCKWVPSSAVTADALPDRAGRSRRPGRPPARPRATSLGSGTLEWLGLAVGELPFLTSSARTVDDINWRSHAPNAARVNVACSTPSSTAARQLGRAAPPRAARPPRAPPGARRSRRRARRGRLPRRTRWSRTTRRCRAAASCCWAATSRRSPRRCRRRASTAAQRWCGTRSRARSRRCSATLGSTTATGPSSPSAPASSRVESARAARSLKGPRAVASADVGWALGGAAGADRSEILQRRLHLLRG